LIFYGFLSKKQLSKIVKNALLYQGYFSKNFFSLLERRLDVILYRSNFAKNILLARQLVSHKKILVNNKIINIPSYTVSPGDIITLNPGDFHQIGNDILKSLKVNFKKRSSRLTISSNFFQKLNSENNYGLAQLSKKIHLFGDQKSPYLKKESKASNNQIDLKERLTNLIKFLIKKTETRAYIKSQKNLLFANNKTNPSFSVKKEPLLFTLFKIKPLMSPQAKFNIFSLIQQNYLTIKKQPNFNINGNFGRPDSQNISILREPFMKNSPSSLVQKEFSLNQCQN
jgi:ribosomal protein S4